MQTGLLLVALVFLCALFLSEDLALGAGASLRTREPVAESSANSMRDAYDEDFASWKAGLSVGGQHFADAAAALVAAQAEHLQSFRLTQRQDLQTFLREQKLFREVAASEFAVAEAAIAEEAHASGIAPLADSQISDGSVATNTSRGTGRDTWAFMIPVIQTNPRRQGRLVKNLCALSWPPKVSWQFPNFDAVTQPMVRVICVVNTNLSRLRHAFAGVNHDWVSCGHTIATVSGSKFASASRMRCTISKLV